MKPFSKDRIFHEPGLCQTNIDLYTLVLGDNLQNSPRKVNGFMKKPYLKEYKSIYTDFSGGVGLFKPRGSAADIPSNSISLYS